MTARRSGTWIAGAVAVPVVATVMAALVVMGSPATQRQARFDERRVEDLQRIDTALRALHARDERLPPTLAEVAMAPGSRLGIVDPRSGQPYGYAIRGARSFRLCAVFETDTGTTPPGRSRPVDADWEHGAGRHCFDRVVEVDDDG